MNPLVSEKLTRNPLLECFCNCFIKDDIQILVSDLSDSTNYITGKRGQLAQLLRIKAPQLLYIDGDIFVETYVKLK